ncbi:hypothetical protein CFP56_006023 [Quercus suber]|uniref:Uncharacterized protein n=1 Tax=Quercus suber TaxID=58331 RepID=A0AAW0M7M5_QUESU
MDRSGGGDESVAEWSLGVRGRQMRVARGRELSIETEAHKLGKALDSNPPQNPKTTKLPNENVNKILNLFGPERVEHLKSKMPELKNKSWNFDPRIGCLLGRGRARFFVWVLT